MALIHASDLDEAAARPLGPALPGSTGPGMALLIAGDVNCRLTVLGTLNQLGYRTLVRRAAHDLPRIERIYQPSVVVADARALSGPLPTLQGLRALALRVPLLVVSPKAATGEPLPSWAARRAVPIDDLATRLRQLAISLSPAQPLSAC